MPHRLSITLTDLNATPSATPLLHVDRAISELRRGQLVVLSTSSGTCSLMLSAEGATKAAINRMKSLSGQTPQLLLTAPRVATLGFGAFETPAVKVTMGKSLRPDLIEALVNPLSDLNKNDYFETTFDAVDPKSADSAAIGLAKLTRMIPAALCVDLPTITDEQGRFDFCQSEDLYYVTVDNVFSYEENAARSLRPVSDAQVPLADAPNTKIVAFRPADGGIEHLAIIVGEPNPNDPVLIRIHSECFTGDLIGSLRCDCGDQLRGGIRVMAEQGSGIVIYLAQEGRGIGLVNKLRAYKLQDQGIDTFDANEQLGFDADERVYLPAAQMLQQLGIKSVRLLTNNPEKVAVLQACGVDVAERVEHAFPTNQHNEPYIFAKATKGGHYL